jgi:hypothetical protein
MLCGELFGIFFFSIAGLSCMIINVGNIKSDTVFKEKMEKGGRIDPSGESKEDSPLH